MKREHRMRDRFQFFPKYNFFNAFKPEGFLSFGFKHYDKRVVSLIASKKNIPVIQKALAQPLLLTLLADLKPELKVSYNPFALNF